MSAPYTIAQRIYLERTHCTNELIESLRRKFSVIIETTSAHDSVVILISTENSCPISENFAASLPALLESKNLLARQNYKGEVLLQIYIKAYEYIPEISFSKEMIKFLAEISAEVDIDVIDLIDS